MIVGEFQFVAQLADLPIRAVPESRQRSPVQERLSRPHVPQLRINPVPRLRAVEQREALTAGLPAFELGLFDADARVSSAVAQRDCRHLGARLDREHRQPLHGEQDSCLAGAGADLQQPLAGAKIGDRDQVLHQRRRIRRPPSVVELGHLTE